MLFFCFGIPKSASTFVYQVTRAAVESLTDEGLGSFRTLNQLSTEFPNYDFAEDAIKDGLKIDEPYDKDKRSRYLDTFVDYLMDKFDGLRDVNMVIKTHLPCSSGLHEKISRGEILASATFRHPAEMILSRHDMAQRNGESLGTDLVSSYRTCVDDFFSWVGNSSVRRYYFDEIASLPYQVAVDIFHHINSTSDSRVVVSELLKDKKNNIWQYNKGVLKRAEQEMDKDKILEIEEQFSCYMQFIYEHNLRVAVDEN